MIKRDVNILVKQHNLIRASLIVYSGWGIVFNGRWNSFRRIPIFLRYFLTHFSNVMRKLSSGFAIEYHPLLPMKIQRVARVLKLAVACLSITLSI